MSECPECGQIHATFTRQTASYRMECPQGHVWTQEIPAVDENDG